MKHDECMKFAAWLQAIDIVLYGERIGIVRDQASEFVGDSTLIVAADTHKRKPKKGVVVLIGEGVKEGRGREDGPDVAGLNVGDHVIVSTYNTVEIAMPTKDGKTVVVDVFHASDIYMGFRTDLEVGPV